jgi:hypothetical protein
MAGTSQGGKNRKYGRNLKSPSAKAYKAERRDLKNKARTVVRIAKEALKRLARITVARGTARRLRRIKEGITK